MAQSSGIVVVTVVSSRTELYDDVVVGGVVFVGARLSCNKTQVVVVVVDVVDVTSFSALDVVEIK